VSKVDVLNVVTARSIWLFDIAELNPSGRSLFPDVFEWLKGLYEFEKVPSSVTDVDETKGLVFSRGRYEIKDKPMNIDVDVELKIYHDGMVANSQSSTKYTDAFLEDTLTSLSVEFGMRYGSEMIKRKLYVSELNVKSNKSLRGINPELEHFAEGIRQLLPAKQSVEFEFGGVSFWPRQTLPPTPMVAFHIERKANTDQSEQKYFSRAPLQTDDHIVLLNEFESTFMI